MNKQNKKQSVYKQFKCVLSYMKNNSEKKELRKHLYMQLVTIKCAKK